MIHLEHVSHTYPHGVRALYGVDLQVARGETIALIGRSGCGKSTLLKTINGLVRPTTGVVRLEEAPLDYEKLSHIRRRIGYVVQQAGLFPHCTVAANIGLLARVEGWPHARITTCVGELLALVGLDPSRFAAKYPHELSGGEQQRVGVARALVLDPPIVLMDEPFSALDPITRTQLQQEFVKWKARLQKTMVLVTHNMAEAFLLGDRVALMEQGNILQIGTPSELASSPATQHVAEFLKGRA